MKRKSIKFVFLAIIALVAFCSGCRTKYRMPPIAARKAGLIYFVDEKEFKRYIKNGGIIPGSKKIIIGSDTLYVDLFY